MSESYVQEGAEREVDVSSPPGRFVVGLLGLLLAGFFVFLAIDHIEPPPAVAADAPPTDFSAARAMRHVQAISERPHPMGSAEHARVGEYIRGELTALGLSPEVQVTSAVTRQPPPMRRIVAGTVRNIAARLEGSGGGKAVMLVAHYDSVPTSPGASDDGAGVALMLETLRTLKAGPQLPNDVIFLFTDGEEVGMLGAKAFVDEHPWARDVGSVLNFEARGTKGPSLMFETGNDNGWTIRQLAQSAPQTVTSSLFFEIYKLLPNATDFSIFKEAGYSGLNFAFTDGFANYHTLSDSVHNIDQRSLQHQGVYALTLTRALGSADLGDTKARNEVYFNLPGSTLLHYSESWVVPSAVLVLLLLAGVLLLGLRRKQLTVLGIILGFLALLGTMLAAAVAVTMVNLVVRTIHSDYKLILQGTTYNNQLYVVGFVAIALGVALLLNNWFRRRVSTSNLLAGGLLWWGVLTGVTSWWMPGASYLFTWPLLFMLVALGIRFLSRADEAGSAKHLAIFSLGAIPGIVLMAPVIYLMSIGLSLSLFRAVLTLIVLLFLLLIPQVEAVAKANRWALPVIALLIGAGFVVQGNRTGGFDANSPKPTNVFYAVDGDSGKAIWATTDRPDEWSAQFFPEGTETGLIFDYVPVPRGFLNHPAPDAQLSLPTVQPLNDVTENGVRTISLNVRSQRQAPVVSVYVESDTEITGATINGRSVGPEGPVPEMRMPGPPMPDMRRTRWGFSYYAPPDEGVELALQTKSQEPVEIRVLDQSFGLPASLFTSLKARPDYMMPTPYPFSPYADSTLVNKRFKFAVNARSTGGEP